MSWSRTQLWAKYLLKNSLREKRISYHDRDVRFKPIEVYIQFIDIYSNIVWSMNSEYFEVYEIFKVLSLWICGIWLIVEFG